MTVGNASVANRPVAVDGPYDTREIELLRYCVDGAVNITYDIDGDADGQC